MRDQLVRNQIFRNQWQSIFKFDSSLLILLLGMISISLMSGCGNIGNHDRYISNSKTIRVNSASVEDTDGYTCPSENNVLPNYAWSLDGSGEFKVCTNDSNRNNLKVRPETATSGRICVFPALYYTQNMVTPVIDPNGGLRKICVAQSEVGSAVNFPDEDFFNFLFIVREQYVNAMEVCLLSGVYSHCPQDWSYGQIR